MELKAAIVFRVAINVRISVSFSRASHCDCMRDRIIHSCVDFAKSVWIMAERRVLEVMRMLCSSPSGSPRWSNRDEYVIHSCQFYQMCIRMRWTQRDDTDGNRWSIHVGSIFGIFQILYFYFLTVQGAKNRTCPNYISHLKIRYLQRKYILD